MTFSVVGQIGEAYGVAVASRFLAVGAVVPAAAPGAGALATRAMAKVSYRADVLALLAGGATAADAVSQVITADEGRDHRQLGVLGSTSQSTWTGPACLAWAGGVSGRDAAGGYAIQGNILVGPDVVAEMERAWLAAADLPLPRRLVGALLAGDAAGGDARCRQGCRGVRRPARCRVRLLRPSRRPPGRRRPGRPDRARPPGRRRRRGARLLVLGPQRRGAPHPGRDRRPGPRCASVRVPVAP